MTEESLTLEQVAELTGVSLRMVYRLRDHGLPVERVRPRGLRVARSALEAWIEAQKGRAGQPGGDVPAQASAGRAGSASAVSS